MLNRALKINYVVPLMTFIMIKATEISLNWQAVIKEKIEILSLNWTLFSRKESGFE
jgi:hypothetical protein